MTTDPNLAVLVVDDFSTMLRITRKQLKAIGYQDVDEAANGKTALEKIKSKQYGLIISDWNMEPMSGYELLQRVRADESTARTPFILVTAECKPDEVAAAKKAGVNDYLIKPFNEKTLKEKIDRVLSGGLME